MGMGAALSCVRAGLSTWGADLNSNACATLKEAGACGVSDNAATFAEKLDALLVLVVNVAVSGPTGAAYSVVGLVLSILYLQGAKQNRDAWKAAQS